MTTTVSGRTTIETIHTPGMPDAEPGAPLEVDLIHVNGHPHISLMAWGLEVEPWEVEEGLDVIFGLDIEEAMRLARAVIGYVSEAGGTPVKQILHVLERLHETEIDLDSPRSSRTRRNQSTGPHRFPSAVSWRTTR